MNTCDEISQICFFNYNYYKMTENRIIADLIVLEKQSTLNCVNTEKLSDETLIRLGNTTSLSDNIYRVMHSRKILKEETKYVAFITTLHKNYKETENEHFDECKYQDYSGSHSDIVKLVSEEYLDFDKLKSKYKNKDFNFKVAQNSTDVFVYMYLYIRTKSPHYFKHINLHLLSNKEFDMIVPMEKDIRCRFDDLIELEIKKRNYNFETDRLKFSIIDLQTEFCRRLKKVTKMLNKELSKFSKDKKKDAEEILTKLKKHFIIQTLHHWNKFLKYLDDYENFANEIENILKIKEFSKKVRAGVISDVIHVYNLVNPDLQLDNNKHYSYKLENGILTYEPVLSTKELISLLTV